jgi:ABC-2 type transport system ATP-binding protein
MAFIRDDDPRPVDVTSHPGARARHQGETHETKEHHMTREIAAVEVDRLAKTYPGEVEAVKGISFAVPAGEVFGLLGPNGAGKSTTIGMLTTTIRPTGGSARLAGHDVVADPLAARAVSSVVFQDPVVDRPLTGRQNLELHARLWRVTPARAPARIAELADSLGLGELLDRPVSTYSGGQRRRLEIARALVSDPRILFLDEPTVGLDPRIRAELIDVIAALRDRTATTILLTTHYLDEAERLCDRLAVVHEGTIVALDTPGALRAELGARIVELRAAGNPELALAELRARGIARDDAFTVGATITIPLHGGNPSEAIAAIERAGVGATSLTSRAPTLDDVYLRLTGGQLAA